MAKPGGLKDLFAKLFRPHPWHGLDPGPRSPEMVQAFIEIVPTDTVKYEIDKRSGYLTIDRPQRYSNLCPSLYGFIPRTLCADRVAALCRERMASATIVGDGDPLDICVLAEHPLNHGDVLLRAIPIGGFRMIDKNEADDKIVAVLEGDAVYGAFRELAEVPVALIDRLKHYFLTYKLGPDQTDHIVTIPQTYDRAEAHEVIRRSRDDYDQAFGDVPGEFVRQIEARLRGRA